MCRGVYSWRAQRMLFLAVLHSLDRSCAGLHSRRMLVGYRWVESIQVKEKRVEDRLGHSRCFDHRVMTTDCNADDAEGPAEKSLGRHQAETCEIQVEPRWAAERLQPGVWRMCNISDGMGIVAGGFAKESDVEIGQVMVRPSRG